MVCLEQIFCVNAKSGNSSVRVNCMDQRAAPGKKVLDLSCGSGVTSETLAKLGFRVTAADYSSPPPMSDGGARVGGVDLNSFLPFRSATFDGVDLVEGYRLRTLLSSVSLWI